MAKNVLRDLMPPILWRIMRKLWAAFRTGGLYITDRSSGIPVSSDQIEEVFRFFSTFQDFRTNERCSTELGYDIAVVEFIKSYLYKEGRLGAYSLGLTGPPHDLMRELVCSRFNIAAYSLILEVGPGANPLFPKHLFPNSYSIDKYGTRGQLLVYGNVKFKESTADFRGGYSTIDMIPEVSKIVDESGGFDLVAGCHSFEHETRPLKALRNLHTILKRGGIVILFVPDGWSDDPSLGDSTHTLHLTPPMIHEFFNEVGGFKDLSIEPFRPNHDLLISAKKF